jgi:uncharacterized protein YceH (UPF0502 family)
MSQNARANCPIHGMFASRAMPSAYDADPAAWRARVEALQQQFGSLEQLVHHVSKSLCDRVEALEKRVTELERIARQLDYGDMLDRDVRP